MDALAERKRSFGESRIYYLIAAAIPQRIRRDYDWSLGPETNRPVGTLSSEIGGEAGHSSLPLVFVTIRVTTGEKSMDEAEQNGQLPAFEDISSDTNIRPAIDRASKALQKLNSARRRQGLSIRCVA